MSQLPATGAVPLISIIIPTFNSAAYIRECLESVFAQTFQDYEVIVVDDGSTDETSSIVQGFGPRVRFVAQENKGPAVARNHGISLAKGAWISFLDSDDLWLPDKLEKQTRFALDHPEYGLITTEASSFDESGVLAPRMKARVYNIRNGLVVRDLLFGNWVQTSGVMVRRECFEKVGKFHEERGLRGTDWILWMQIAAQYPIYFMEEPLAKIRLVRHSFSHHDPEKQFWTLFRALDIIRETIPSLPADLINQAACRICHARALGDAHAGRFGLARKKLRYALGLNPFQAKMWALLVACSIPPLWKLAVAVRKGVS